MAYEAKPNSGSLFKADKKSDKAPDYTGSFKDSTGKEWRLAAWVKEGAKGKFFSLLASEPQAKATQLLQGAAATDDTNDLPF
tara:strand:+ start:2262 stop:2507 length:246 start_codon:yes stop_codon:yes gene_type:complete